MKVILPVAGKGTRLKPLTHTTTKSLLRVGSRRMLGNVMDSLGPVMSKIEKFIFITDSGNDDQIRTYVAKHFPNCKAEYVLQKEKLGPAHAIWLAKPHINANDDVLIIFNDTLFFADLSKIFTIYSDCDGLIYSFPTDDPKRFGIIIHDCNGNIVDMIEKPQYDVGSNLAIVGLYYIRDGSELMNKIEFTMQNQMTDTGDKKEYYLNLPMKLMIQEGKKFMAPKLDDWLDCGKKETLLESSRKLLEKLPRKDYNRIYLGSIINHPVDIDDSVKITNSVIGPNVSIGGNVEIINSIIKDSIINPGARVENMVLKFSLIGENADVKGNCHSIDLGDDSNVNLGA